MMMRKSNHSLYHATVTKFNLGTPSWKEVQGPLSSFSTHGKFTLSIIEKKKNKTNNLENSKPHCTYL